MVRPCGPVTSQRELRLEIFRLREKTRNAGSEDAGEPLLYRI